MSTRTSAGTPLGTSRQWLLGLFFIASGLLALWQLRPAPESPIDQIERARLPDYVVSRFSAVETDAAGRPNRRLVADELRQYVDEDVSELDQPRMTLYQAEREPWRARAENGLVLEGGDEVRLRGAVELTRAGDATHRETHMASELIRIWHKRTYAETDQAVRIRSEQDWLTATGMRLWYDAPMRAQFDGRVHLFLAPQQVVQP